MTRQSTNLSSIDSTIPDRHHRNFRPSQRTEWAFRTCQDSACRQTHQNWKYQAIQYQPLLTIPHAQTARHCFWEPKKEIFHLKNSTQWQLGQFTKTSASRKTHFSNCVRVQQCNFVNVIPSSGRLRTARFAVSCESKTLTSCTKSKAFCKFNFIASDTPGVMSTASWWAVDTLRNEWARTSAPSE